MYFILFHCIFLFIYFIKLSDTKGKRERKKEKITDVPYIDISTNKGYTALHLAIVENEIRMIKLLLDNRANHAVSKKYTIVLYKKYINFYFKAFTLKKWYPLHFAAHIGNTETCKLLLALDENMALLKNESGDRPFEVAMGRDHQHLLELLNHKKLKKSSSNLLKRGSSAILKRSKKKEKAEEEEETKKETIIIDNTKNVSLLDMFELPEFEGKEGESLIDAISNNPKLIQQMKDDPIVFLKYLPRDMQELLVKDIERDPMLLQEVVEIGKDVMMKVLEEHPEQLLSAMQNPLQLFKRANTPAKLLKLIKQLEENPMSVLKDEFQQDPELFLIKELRDNPRLLYLVVERIRETKPQLLPLLRFIIGVNPEDAKEPAYKEKGIAGKMKSKVVKATVNKFLKKMSEEEDPNLEKLDLSDVININEEQSKDLDEFRSFLNSDASETLKRAGINGPLFTLEEYTVKLDKDGNPIEGTEEPAVPLPNPDQEEINELEKHAAKLDLD